MHVWKGYGPGSQNGSKNYVPFLKIMDKNLVWKAIAQEIRVEVTKKKLYPSQKYGKIGDGRAIAQEIRVDSITKQLYPSQKSWK